MSSRPATRSGDPQLRVIAEDLHGIAIRLLRQVRQEDDRSGLTSGRLSALSVLVFGGPMTLGELARAERVSLPTMTRIAAALTAAGYVKRTIDPNDRRYVSLTATSRGVALLEEGRTRRVERLTAMLSALDARERAACARAVGALARVFRS